MSSLRKLLVCAACVAATHGALAAPMQSDDPTGAGQAAAGALLMQTALRDLARGALDVASGEFEAAAKADPAAPGPLLGMAEVALRRGDAGTAETDIRSAISRSPGSVLAHAAYARLLVRKNDLDGALAEFNAAILLNPRDPTLPLARGDIQALALNRPVDAIASYRQAISTDPGYAPAHYELGRVLARTRQWPEARAELKTATQLAPGDAMAWSALGNVLSHTHQAAAAIIAFDTALKIAPSLVEAQVGRGDALSAAGRSADALAAYGAAGAADGSSALALVRRGVLLQGLQRPSDAVQDFKAAIALNPDDADAQNDLAYTLAETGRDLDLALDAATKAVALSPATPLYKDTLAWVYHARGDLTAALDILRPLAATANEPIVDYHLGLIYQATGSKPLAQAAFNAALRLDSGFIPAKKALR